jgi:ferredoxin-NADP reductase
MAMLRHHARLDEDARARVPVRLLYSARTADDVIYREELETLGARPGVEIAITLTRGTPPAWPGLGRRVDRAMLEGFGWPAADMPRLFVCGPTPFVESVANTLIDLGHDPARVRTERFGPTG